MGNYQPLIELSGVSFAYPDGGPVLTDVDFTFLDGDRIGLLAPNGSGKTTFFHLIMGLLKPRQGTIRIFGKPVQREKDFVAVRRQIGLLFQDSDDQLFCPTVLEDVAFGPLNMGKSRQEASRIARDIILSMGLAGYEDRVTYKLSGGEKRLVAMAAVLAMGPRVLLLDEPLTGLDGKTRRLIENFLLACGLPYIIISHDVDFLMTTTDALYTLEAGRLYPDTHIHLHRHEHAHLLGNHPHKHN
ncbi:MAG: energy-coupling factor ABC transporter ATP-binding protein [Thermodesulfobacteriota bacterium]